MQEDENADLVFSCTKGGRCVRITAWELATGSVQRTYSCDAEGGGSCVYLLGKDYLLCSLKTLPFIYVWNIRKEQVHLKIACPGCVGALACSPEGTYCAGAIGEKIYVWEVSSGHLLAVVSQHYQPVAVLRFTDDGTHFISGGADARVIVWRLGSVLSEAFVTSGQSIPYSLGVDVTMPRPSLTRHVWSDHSLPVTDIHCGTGGLRARVVTVSLDQTAKLYELSSGQLLCSLLFDSGLTSVAVDLAAHRLFVGGSTGKIFQVNLFLHHPSSAAQHSSLDFDREASTDQHSCFKGHTKAVRGLAVSSWGHQLVSVAEDSTGRVWDINSGQELRSFPLKSPVSSMFLARGVKLSPLSRGPPSYLPPLQPFRKQLHYNAFTEGRGEGGGGSSEGKALPTVPIVIEGIDPLCDLATLKDFDCGFTLPADSIHASQVEGLEVHKLQQEMSELKDVHRRLYGFVVDELIDKPVD